MRNQLKETFAAFMKTNNMRQTPERFAILDKALNQKMHFDIDSLYNDIENEYHVSRTTVYNTMELLCECKIFRKHFINDSQAVYELYSDKHIHLICSNCGSMTYVRDDKADEYFSSLRFKGFHTSFSTINIYGLCSKCSRKQKRKPKTKKLTTKN